jgi:murein L,D-transpeptidase YcbB/YkuD
MPLTDKYSKKVHDAYQATQEKGGMTSPNLKKLQKLLKYYPENKGLKTDGFYGGNTIEAINVFYDKYYWTQERKMQALKDKHGEKYIMQSELEGMQETPPDTSGQGGY